MKNKVKIDKLIADEWILSRIKEKIVGIIKIITTREEIQTKLNKAKSKLIEIKKKRNKYHE